MSQIAIVTGASRGIGYETCRALAERGMKVLAVARSADPLNNLEEHHPDMITALPADLTDSGAVDLVAEAAGAYDGVSALVNNAGLLINRPFEELTMDDWQRLIDVNLFSAVRLTRGLLPQFREGSHIVNIGSMGGYQGSAKFPGLAGYSVAKGAVSILTECLAAELGNRGIRVNALCPGAVQTEMLEEAFPGLEAPVSAAQMGKYVADFALDGAKLYNGQVLPVTLGDPGS